MREAARTLAPVPGVDLEAYAKDLRERFANPAIAHQTYQIAMDGTEKLPQRLVAPALDARAAGQDIAPFAFAVAAWMRHCLGRLEDGSRHPLRDPRAGAIATRLAGLGDDPGAIAGALLDLREVFPEAFAADGAIRDAVTAALGRILGRGIATAMRAELAAAG
jgi:fructuronate reductase